MEFNPFDIVIVIIMLITALIGFMRGFVWMSVFIATWVVAILLVFKYKDVLSASFNFKQDLINQAIAIGIILLSVLTIGAIINYLFSRAVKALKIGMFDRLLGTGLGLGLGALTVSLAIILGKNILSFENNDKWLSSKFIPKFTESANWLETTTKKQMSNYITPSNSNNNDSNIPLLNNASVKENAQNIITPSQQTQ